MTRQDPTPLEDFSIKKREGPLKEIYAALDTMPESERRARVKHIIPHYFRKEARQ